MTHTQRALGLSPNPSGWRKIDIARVDYARRANTAEIGTHSRAEIWSVTKRAMRCMKLNATAQMILEALVFRTFEDDWKDGARPIVWQQNAAIARAAGLAVSTSTVRSALACLASHGLITYQDSGNCRRAGRRGADGKIEFAYGIDLSILVSRHQELRELADAHDAAHAERVEARTAVQKLRRQIPAHCQSAMVQQLLGRWPQFKRRYDRISRIVGRTSSAPLDHLKRALRAYSSLLGQIQKAMLDNVQNENIDATASDSACLLETTTQPLSVSCNGERHRASARSVNSHTDDGYAAEKIAYENDGGDFGTVQHKPEALRPRVYIETVVKACPDVADFGHIESWQDLVSVTGQLRGSLGISPQAWHEARARMGADNAAIALAIIIQKSAGGHVRTPGAYLRGMTAKVADGTLHLDRTIHALIAEQETRPKRHMQAGADTLQATPGPWRPRPGPTLI
ncbi:plasmid replication protein RepC [Agrobacterium larrymoorei]|uniref:Replication protein C n=1 Tax=Agrobacterium larrymoorei TaxID=160699 RepID=A0ABX8TCV2_9HYPH|nr:plasmid replication protein RepC [Agrobacterium larrymoorei]QYA10848.1 hypothetical protein J5285_25825 [Agrobacterium larrymoorei]